MSVVLHSFLVRYSANTLLTFIMLLPFSGEDDDY